MSIDKIQTAITGFLKKTAGNFQEIEISFSENFVLLNSIEITLNDVSIGTTLFDTSHQKTVLNICKILNDSNLIQRAKPNGDSSKILVKAQECGIELDIEIEVTGGASQPEITVLETVESLVVPCYLAPQNYPQSDFFAVYEITATANTGIDGINSLDENLSLILGHRVSTILLELHGNDALKKAHEIALLLKTSYWNDFFNQYESSPVSVGGIRDLSGLNETEYKEIGVIEFFLSHVQYADFGVGTIKNINMTSVINENEDALEIEG